MIDFHLDFFLVCVLTGALSSCAQESKKPEQVNGRIPEYKVSDIILHRTSKRAMSGEEISHSDLMSLLEAFRWAPFSFNEQPGRVLYALRGTKNWDLFFNLLVPFNQSWVKDAAALLVIISRDNFSYNNKPNATHAFDTGAAWQNLALQGSMMGLVIHAMSGFDYEKARADLKIPEGYTIEAMVAVGKPGPIENLPENIRQKELKPSDRKPVSEFTAEGQWTDHIK